MFRATLIGVLFALLLFSGTAWAENCTSSADCLENQFCVDGECVFGSTQCLTDTDCLPWDVCIEMTCQAKDCSTDGECGEWALCVAGLCSPVDAPGCADDADCDDGFYCESGECVENSTGECVTSDDCADGKLCYDGLCVGEEPGIECETSFDCKEGATCENGWCVGEYPDGECASDAECGANQVCAWNWCEPSQDYCKTNDECSKYGLCDLECVLWEDPGRTGDCTSELGKCRLNPEAIPESSECVDFCIHLEECDDYTVIVEEQGEDVVMIFDVVSAEDMFFEDEPFDGRKRGGRFKGDDISGDMSETQECIYLCSVLADDSDTKAKAAELIECTINTPCEKNPEAKCDDLLNDVMDTASKDSDLGRLFEGLGETAGNDGDVHASDVTAQDDVAASAPDTSSGLDSTTDTKDSSSSGKSGCTAGTSPAGPASLALLILAALSVFIVRRLGAQPRQ